MDTVQKLFRFLDESPTCYHAAANTKAALTAAVWAASAVWAAVWATPAIWAAASSPRRAVWAAPATAADFHSPNKSTCHTAGAFPAFGEKPLYGRAPKWYGKGERRR